MKIKCLTCHAVLEPIGPLDAVLCNCDDAATWVAVGPTGIEKGPRSRWEELNRDGSVRALHGPAEPHQVSEGGQPEDAEYWARRNNLKPVPSRSQAKRVEAQKTGLDTRIKKLLDERAILVEQLREWITLLALIPADPAGARDGVRDGMTRMVADLEKTRD